MKKFTIFLMIALCFSHDSYGQKELEMYKSIYNTADSLKASGQIGSIDFDSLFVTVKTLEKEHPDAFFDVINDYMSASKFNEASFVYFLSLMRFGYYNSVNPDYNHNRQLNYLVETYGGIINHYLRTAVDHYISIIKMAVTYYIDNDYAFFSKDNNIEKYNLQTEVFHDFVLDIEKNKTHYIKLWHAERKKIEAEINKPKLEQYNQGYGGE